MNASTYKPPSHLSPETRKWFTGIVQDFVLESHHIRLLTLAAEAWDRCAAARQVIDRDGMTYVDRFNAPRARPEIAVERDSRLAFTRCLRELALDGVSGPELSSRPPGLRGIAR
jgi:phage terminase small subunit